MPVADVLLALRPRVRIAAALLEDVLHSLITERLTEHLPIVSFNFHCSPVM